MTNGLRIHKIILVFCVVALLVLSGLALYLQFSEEATNRVPGRDWYTLEDMKLDIDSPYLESAVMGGLYLVNCQRSDGSFNYQYDPEKDSYSTDNNMLRQLRTTYSVLLIYKHYPESIFLETGELAMEYIEDYVEYIDTDTAHIVHNGDSKLGGAALALLCYVSFEKVADARYRETLDALGNFLIFSQDNATGEFNNYYQVDGKIPAEGDKYYWKHTDYYPGEAFLVLAFLYQHTREEKYKDCWDLAFDYYYNYYGGENSYYSPFSPWATGAALIMYQFEKDERYVEMSRSMADRVLYGQDQYPQGFEIPEYVGGFYYDKYVRYQKEPVGEPDYYPRANTASKIEGPMDYYWMMERYDLSGDKKFYRDRMLLGSDFLLTLQYNDSDAKAFPDPKKAYGGVPGGVNDRDVRIDYNQHAIVAWIKIHDYLVLKEDLLMEVKGEERVHGRNWFSFEDLKEPVGSPYLEASVAAGLYLVNCQRPDGSFNYQYDPREISYSSSDNMLRQLGTTYSILLLYRNYPEKIFLDAGELAMGYVEEHVGYIDQNTAHIVHEGDSKLGGAALAVLCYVTYEKVADDRYRDTLDALGNFFIFSQDNATGEFNNYYQVDGRIPEEGDNYYWKHTDYYPGEALLALAFLYQHTREERYMECWELAFDYYYNYYGGENSDYSPFSPWATGAALIMYEFQADERYVNMSRSMAESVLTGQDQYPEGFEIPEYVGGFYYQRYLRYQNDPDGEPDYHPRANTASKIEGAMDFYWMMERYNISGDKEFYKERTMLASDFLVMLQYNESDSDSFPSPRRCFGGVPGGVADREIRIDYNQHAMVAWLKTYNYIEQKKGILG